MLVCFPGVVSVHDYNLFIESLLLSPVEGILIVMATIFLYLPTIVGSDQEVVRAGDKKGAAKYNEWPWTTLNDIIVDSIYRTTLLLLE